MINFKTLLIVSMVIGMVFTPFSPLLAKDIPVTQDTKQLEADAGTHPPLRLTPEKSELVRLPRSAASIIVGNPAHMNVMADSADTLVIIPRMPGASHFTVLDEYGDIIIQRHVIIASPQKNYIRVRRSCANGDESCQSTSVYFCPGSCHEIAMSEADDSNASTSEEPINSASGNNSALNDQPVPQADSP